LAQNGWSEDESLLAIQDLTTQSLLRPYEDKLAVAQTKIFKASDLSVPYLQAPFIVELEMTHACYRECTHCAYNASPHADRKGELSTSSWKEVIKKLADAGVLSLRFTGGDFMYRSDAIELLEYADTLGIAYHFLSDTIALNERNMQSVKQLRNLAYIGTSIDGSDRFTHDGMRGAGAFDLLVERVRRITSQGITMSLGTTLHKQNWKHVRETGKLASALGATYFELGFLCPIGRGANLQEQVLNGQEVRESLQLYLDGVRAGEYKPMQLHYYTRAQKTEATAFSDLSEIVDRLPFQTEWPFSRLRVKPDGTTYTAGKLKESGLSIGINILLDDLDTIWRNSPNLVTLRKIGVGRRLHSLDIAQLPKELHHG
jgi:MoaA/NifB/PqqE/SkfB family radical SAM enzyme